MQLSLFGRISAIQLEEEKKEFGGENQDDEITVSHTPSSYFQDCIDYE